MTTQTPAVLEAAPCCTRDALVKGATLLAVLAGAAAYPLVVRPWHMRWGATDDEIAQPMPMDDHVAEPTYVTNRAVTIHARPEQVWPWLAQIGEGRAAFYSYDWIERLIGMDVDSADRIHPEWQQLQVGDRLTRDDNILVRYVEPGRFLVVGPTDDNPEAAVTWAFGLYPDGEGGTRLVSRVRAQIKRWTPFTVLYLAALDPGQLLMERRMLLEIKRLAERDAPVTV